MSSPAPLAVIPLQDILGLGTDARMNTPGKPDGTGDGSLIGLNWLKGNEYNGVLSSEFTRTNS